jgi:uncharacterized protein (UPF0147 family)
MVEYMLSSLPDHPEFNTLQGAIRYGTDDLIMKPDEVRERIRMAAARQTDQHKEQRENHQKKGYEKRENHLKKGYEKKYVSDHHKGRNVDGKFVCHGCGSTEHFIKECPNREKKTNGNDQKRRSNWTQRSSNQNEKINISLEDLKDWWCFDTGSNTHVVGDKSLFISMMETTDNGIQVHGVTPELATKVQGVGTVALATEIDGEKLLLFIDDVCYVPEVEYNLLSPGMAQEQGFDIDFDSKNMVFIMRKEGKSVLKAKKEQGMWGFYSENTHTTSTNMHERLVVNYSSTDGVASLTRWHERLGHTCHQYLKIMSDQGLVNGMMLTQRQKKDCSDCHLGKQRKKAFKKKIDRNITTPNQVVFGDVMFLSQRNGSRNIGFLVIMDGYSRYLTVHLLTSKDATTVNKHMKNYVLWAERQAGRRIGTIIQREELENGVKFPVQQVWTDKGGEFVNRAIDDWYAARGIEHEKVGPKSSQLNLCERAHQSLSDMAKTMMKQSGLPSSLFVDAFLHAVYLKNRLYCKHTSKTPYEGIFNTKPDIHHIRKFGALAYIHVPKTPQRHKEDDNAVTGFVLGYAEDVIGCKVYFPQNHTKKWVSDLRVVEEVMYRDRHEVDAEDMESWLNFQSNANDSNFTESDIDQQIAEQTPTHLFDDDLVDIEASVQSDINVSMFNPTFDVEKENKGFDQEVNDQSMTGIEQNGIDINDDAFAENDSLSERDSVESFAGVCGSQDEEIREHEEDQPSDISINLKVSNESVISSTKDGSVQYSGGEEDVHNLPIEVSPNEGEIIELPRRLFKRDKRSETLSELKNIEGDQKRIRRPGLRDISECRTPKRFEDFYVNTIGTRVLDKTGRPIRDSNVKMPRNYREAMRSKYADFWKQAQIEEINALKAKSVLEEFSDDKVPQEANTIMTMWVWALKSDHQGYVTRFKARLVARGDKQRPGIDFLDTFAPVARMSSFRLTIGLAATMGLQVYGGDINTAYLNATLKIPQYVKEIQGFPCEHLNHCYVVRKALYGLRQAGREWNDELNHWLLTHGFQRCTTEPCLYFSMKEGDVMIVLVYVDDILCATNKEQLKVELFHNLDTEYGVKDQGLLNEYLGIEVEQDDENIAIHQTKYTKKILEKYGYENSHKTGNPMQSNMHLTTANKDDEFDSDFDYRGALGMLMYLATSTRPDIAYVVGQLSRFASNPTRKHVGTLKRVFRYLVGTINHGITYRRSSGYDEKEGIKLHGFCDSDWAGDTESRKSTTGFVFTLADGAIAWMSRRQTIIALSTAEAEYVSACEATMEAASEYNILQEILLAYKISVTIGIDNQAAYIMATNPTYSRRTRHIELRWHFVREQVMKGVIDLHKIKGEDNPADAFTKPLDKTHLEHMNELMGVGIITSVQ